jgi:outer membrane protein insertion porin family
LPEADLRFAASQTVFLNADSGGAGKTEVSADVRAQTDGGRFGFGAHLAGGHLGTMGSGRAAITDRFQLGGDSLRGFSERSIGPSENGFSLGGNSFAALRIEGDMRVASFENVELRSGIFADAGSVWGLDNATPGIDAAPNLRSAVGVSISVEVSDVPIDLYYAVPVNQEDDDQVQNFGFSLSRKF